MDEEKSPQGRCRFSLSPSLAAKAKKGSILYFWQEQLDQLNKNYDDFIAQYSEEHERETSRYFRVGGSVDTASHESGDDTGSSTSYAEPTDDEILLQLADKSKTGDAQHLHWNSMLGQLATYKRKTGHCNVPSSNKSNKALGEWVQLQRAKARAGQLSEEKIESLETLGFKWVTCSMNSQQIEATWYIMLENLIEYKLKTGDCLVPQRYEENIALGTWCKNQRWKRKHDRLSADHKARLEEIGFPWTIPEKDRRRRGKAKSVKEQRRAKSENNNL